MLSIATETILNPLIHSAIIDCHGMSYVPFPKVLLTNTEQVIEN